MEVPAPRLLIDGDLEAYRAAFRCQNAIPWDPENPSVYVHPEEAAEYLAAAIRDYQKLLGITDVTICLSDTANWRKELWPEYKAHRKNLVKPVLLSFCKEYLKEHFQHEQWPRLEADDVMGILATEHPEWVMVSVDKDMLTVPGQLYRPNRKESGIIQTSPEEAFLNHMIQTLVGDTADGYKGCPGIGPKTAEKILSVQSRKADTWGAVVSAFAKRGLLEAEALLNARLASILTTGRYSRDTGKVKLWRPPAPS